jgi:putative oxidoreductase
MKTKKSKGLNIALWIAQSILALLFLMSGTMKSTIPMGQLYVSLNWTKDVPMGLVRFIGVFELLIALGLLLPSLLRIIPVLTPVAASALILIMILAIIFHISRGEANIIGMHIAFIILASFIAWGRFKNVPIHSKN